MNNEVLERYGFMAVLQDKNGLKPTVNEIKMSEEIQRLEARITDLSNVVGLAITFGSFPQGSGILKTLKETL